MAVTTRLISGTFMQLDHWDDQEGRRFQEDLRRLDAEGWRRMVRDMAAIGIDTLVFQQGADARHGMADVRCYYPGGRWPVPDWMRAKPDLYDAVVDEADRLGMKIFHAIFAMGAPDPILEEARAVEFASVLVDELGARYGGRPSFAGWYWTYEYPPGCSAGRDSLRRIVAAVRARADAPVLIAPNADRPLCCSTLQDIDVDVIAYQDTVGLGVEPDIFSRHARAGRHRSLDRLPFLYEQLKYIHDAWTPEDDPMPYWNYYHRRRGRTALWNDLEIWEFDHRKELVPTELSRVVAQLELTAPYVDKQIIYQYPGLMQHPDHPVPVGGERARTLYETYALYRDKVLRDSVAP